MRDEQERELLRGVRVPGEEEACRRAWEVVRAAYADRAALRRRSPALRAAVALGVAVMALALLLSPAGAAVRGWLSDVVTPGAEDAKPALTSLPGGGKLAVSTSSAAWSVAEDGSIRRLGHYREADWSPNGIFLVATSGRQLAAIDPRGEVRWAISRPVRIADPRWAPSGFRVAYRSGRQLRVIAGDGSEDRLLRAGVRQVAPAWRPLAAEADAVAAANVLAYVGSKGRIFIRDVDSGRTLWHGGSAEAVRQLVWMGPSRLVAIVRDGAVVFELEGRPKEVAVRGRVVDADAIGSRLALLSDRGDGFSVAEVARVGDGLRPRRVFSGPGPISGVTFSPNGRRLLLGWRGADQWIFVRAADGERQKLPVKAFAGIARQFSPGRAHAGGFPIVEGWCCRERGGP